MIDLPHTQLAAVHAIDEAALLRDLAGVLAEADGTSLVVCSPDDETRYMTRAALVLLELHEQDRIGPHTQDDYEALLIERDELHAALKSVGRHLQEVRNLQKKRNEQDVVLTDLVDAIETTLSGAL